MWCPPGFSGQCSSFRLWFTLLWPCRSRHVAPHVLLALSEKLLQLNDGLVPYSANKVGIGWDSKENNCVSILRLIWFAAHMPLNIYMLNVFYPPVLNCDFLYNTEKCCAWYVIIYNSHRCAIQNLVSHNP